MNDYRLSPQSTIDGEPDRVKLPGDNCDDARWIAVEWEQAGYWAEGQCLEKLGDKSEMKPGVPGLGKGTHQR